MPKYKVGIKIQLEDSPREDQVRYVQCGFGGKSRIFSGHISDYMGGGDRRDFYFLDGKLIVEADLCSQHWSIEIQAFEDQYPDLLDEICDMEGQYFYYENKRYMVKEFFLEEYKKLPEGRLFQRGPLLPPMTVGNTGFSDVPNYPEGFPEWSKEQYGFDVSRTTATGSFIADLESKRFNKQKKV